MKFHLPEKPEEWSSFEIPAEFGDKAGTHEDKVMIAKWTFLKPELTYLHIKKICGLLEDQYFSVQMMPVLKLLEVFSSSVLENPILQQSHVLA